MGDDGKNATNDGGSATICIKTVSWSLRIAVMPMKQIGNTGTRIRAMVPSPTIHFAVGVQNSRLRKATTANEKPILKRTQAASYPPVNLASMPPRRAASARQEKPGGERKKALRNQASINYFLQDGGQHVGTANGNTKVGETPALRTPATVRVDRFRVSLKVQELRTLPTG